MSSDIIDRFENAVKAYNDAYGWGMARHIQDARRAELSQARRALIAAMTPESRETMLREMFDMPAKAKTP